MLDLPDEPALLLSVLPPGQRQQRIAFAVVAFALVLIVATAPFATLQLPFYPLALAVMQTLIIGADLLVAVMLYSKFSILGWRSLLWLAGSYLYSAIVGGAHYLSFPGIVSPTGALGAQTTGWLFAFWRIALPIAAIAFALRRDRDPDDAPALRPTRTAIAQNFAAMAAVAFATIGLAVLAGDRLPPWMDGAHFTPLARMVNAATALLFASALGVLWARRRSVLDLWLMASLAVSLISLVYIVVAVGARFSFAYYAVRAYWLTTSLLILTILLSETTTLYARLAYAIVLSRRRSASQAVAVNAMSASFAHELSQPVAAMIANGEAALLWLSRTPPDLGKARSSVEQLASDGKRAREAITSVRAMFQDGAAHREAIEVNPVIREVLAIEDQHLHDFAVQVELDLGEQLPQVMVERTQLQQVILNLVANAVDAMAPMTDQARLMRIQTRATGQNGLLIVFADTGSGLGEANPEQVFEPFFTTKAEGLGLGLWICRRIIELHGGRLTAEPGPGRGSIFTIALPSLSPG